MPHQPFLDDYQRDIVNVASFASAILGLISLILSFVTIFPARWAKQAAEAAKEAAERAARAARQDFEFFSLSNVRCDLRSIRSYADTGKWERASICQEYLARHNVQFAHSDADWRQITAESREWAETMKEMTKDKFLPQKAAWLGFVRRIQRKLDEKPGPFRDNQPGG